jgi:hypothetical protein
MTKPALLAEFVTIFVLLPLGYRFSPVQLPPLPLLWVVALYCYLTLRHEQQFTSGWLWNAQGGLGQLWQVAAIFAMVGAVIVLGVWRLAPASLFSFPRARLGLWALVMVLYPVVSVYPQGLVYRAFLMHRYARLFAAITPTASSELRGWMLILVSAIAFGFLHIIFRNPLAVWMTFAGGLLFAWRYQATGSLALSSFEHALYGCWLFTIGLGQYFYIGRVKFQ